VLASRSTARQPVRAVPCASFASSSALSGTWWCSSRSRGRLRRPRR
jgi:hypothetical protein